VASMRLAEALEDRSLRRAVCLGAIAVGLGATAVGLMCTGCESSAPLSASTSVVIDGNSRGRIFDGIGAVSAGASSRLLIDYPEPQRDQILDYLFKPNYGAALQHLKVEIGADVNSTDGSEPSYARTPTDRDFTRGYEWWLMDEARKRNPNIVLDSLPWGAPGWVDKFYSKKMAEYVAGFIGGAKQTYGLDIAYTGVWNETPYNTDYVEMLRQVLDQKGLKTKIVCCDEYPRTNVDQWRILAAIKKDPALRDAIAVVSVHYPRVNGKVTTPPGARDIGKPLWSSEDQPASSASKILSRDWAIGGRALAQLYNDNYLNGSFTATEIWSPITSYYDILAAPNSGLMYANTPWSGNYDVQGAIWATAHTTQFAQPGWQYLDSSCGHLPEKGDYVALKSPNGQDWSVILQTIDASQSQRVDFRIAGGLKAGTIHVWETNSTKTFVKVADLEVRDGKFSYNFDPDSLYSLTTTTGQGRGSAAPPPAAGFPFPWREDFEKIRLHGTPPFLTDQDGAFEVNACGGRDGHCLEQVITEKPIPWGPLPDPWTLAGDASWTDYRVRSEVRLMGQGSVMILGRIDSADVFADQKAQLPSGYVFRIVSGGAWSLLSAEYKKPTRTLAQGKLHANGRNWQQLELVFQGNRLSASLDGKVLASVQDDAHTHGMFGIGTGWNHAQFDDVSVTNR
jgi:Glycosyl hydrolase family 59